LRVKAHIIINKRRRLLFLKRRERENASSRVDRVDRVDRCATWGYFALQAADRQGYNSDDQKPERISAVQRRM
jgi:hypothetical protein